MEAERIKGRVIWFKGTYGYICPEGKSDGEADVFFHFSQINAKEGTYRSLAPNDKVSFKVGANHKGPMAVDLVKE